MTVYPAQIDDSISLPPASDKVTSVSAASVNQLRSALLAVEMTLGINPASIYGTVSNRLNIIEGINNGVVTKFGTYTIQPLDKYLLINTSSASSNLTLGSVQNIGETHYIKDISNNANNNHIVITSTLGKIEDATTYTINIAAGAVKLVSDGSNWWAVAKY